MNALSLTRMSPQFSLLILIFKVLHNQDIPPPSAPPPVQIWLSVRPSSYIFQELLISISYLGGSLHRLWNDLLGWSLFFLINSLSKTEAFSFLGQPLIYSSIVVIFKLSFKYFHYSSGVLCLFVVFICHVWFYKLYKTKYQDIFKSLCS